MDFLNNNLPFSFFLHCDDVEFGLRHGGCPIILNGIQVWHETYEYRQSPVISYYDIRNSLLVNDIYNVCQKKEQIYQEWKTKISDAHLKKNWTLEYMLIKGFADYLKGIDWLEKIDSEKNHYSIIRKKGNRFLNCFLWRWSALKFLIKMKGK